MLSIPFGQAPFAFALAEQLNAALLVATLLLACPINSIDAELSAFALMCTPGLAVPGTSPPLITIEPGRLRNIAPDGTVVKQHGEWVPIVRAFRPAVLRVPCPGIVALLAAIAQYRRKVAAKPITLIVGRSLYSNSPVN